MTIPGFVVPQPFSTISGRGVFLEYLSTTSASVTFSNFNIGTAAANRLVIMAVHAAGGGSFVEPTYTVPGTWVNFGRLSTVQVSAASRYVWFIGASVPTGTTATVTFTYSASAKFTSAAVYALYDVDVITNHVSTGNSSSYPNIPATVYGNGVSIGAMTGQDYTTALFWANANQTYDSGNATGFRNGGAIVTGSPTGQLTGANAASLSVVSFPPLPT